MVWLSAYIWMRDALQQPEYAVSKYKYVPGPCNSILIVFQTSNSEDGCIRRRRPLYVQQQQKYSGYLP